MKNTNVKQVSQGNLPILEVLQKASCQIGGKKGLGLTMTKTLVFAVCVCLVNGLYGNRLFFLDAHAIETLPPANPQSGQLSVEPMIRQQKDASELFSRLYVDNRFLMNATVAPMQRSQAVDGDTGIVWDSQAYYWQSPAFCHSPLYFEQPNFERYGIRSSSHIAPTLSAAHFFGTAVLLPLKAIYQPPWTASCTLGNRRPGDCNPIQRLHVQH